MKYPLSAFAVEKVDGDDLMLSDYRERDLGQISIPAKYQNGEIHIAGSIFPIKGKIPKENDIHLMEGIQIYGLPVTKKDEVVNGKITESTLNSILKYVSNTISPIIIGDILIAETNAIVP